MPTLSPIRRAWQQMKVRCNDKKFIAYHRYGGRGITYDPNWNSYSVFLSDMGSSYQPGLSLDRIDSNGNYCKENCRWVTKAENTRNAARCKLSMEKAAYIRRLYAGGGMSQGQLGRMFGVDQSCISDVVTGKAYT